VDGPEDAAFAEARDKALRYLAYRARTRKETAARLAREDYESETVERVLEFLESYGYVNDESCAREHIQARLAAGYGGARVRYELLSRGIPRDMANRLLGDLNDADEAKETALSLLRKKMRGIDEMTPKDASRCWGFLSRRGFSPDVIRQAMKDFNEWEE